ncbi:hypothetical protein BDR26DRAFT_933200 [Obelidium mucronatum]|nr:hypothetical protein BDR26DRAFT_933200 [Obelidium mucronatum]
MGKHHSNSDSSSAEISKEQHKRKKSKKSTKADSDSEPEKTPKVDNPITADDFYTKSSEFIVWLREKKKLSLSNLSSKEARKYFDKFVKKWNSASLSEKYYRGISTTDIASNQRSTHKWNFKVSDADEARLTEAKDSVHVMTAMKLEAERRGGKGKSDNREGESRGGFGKTGGGGSSTNSSGANSLPVGNRDDDSMDPEDRARYERALRKKDFKSFDSTRQVAIDEIAPKATGREAQIEKKRAINAYHKQERDTDVSLNDSDLMGGGDSFAAHMARERERKRRLEERKLPDRQHQRQDIDSRVQSYQAKEDATMMMMRDLAKKFTEKNG